MAGSPEQTSQYVNLKLKRVMDECHVNEETAEKLLVMATTLAQELNDKWCSNTLKVHSNQAEDIYKLLKQLQQEGLRQATINEDSTLAETLLADIEKKVLALCIKPY